jgi:hypothetical protein
MRKLSILTLLVLAGSLAAQILAPIVAGGPQCCTYYISNTGSDSANGLTPTTAKQTIAAVNALTLLPGQSVGFKRGGTWRETLTPGQSGAAGSPITFGSYGSGAQPIINGADVFTPWTSQAVGASGNVAKADMRLSTISGTAFVDFGAAGSLTPYLGSTLVITDSAGKHLTGYIKAAGSSETLGTTEYVPNTAFSNTSNVWTSNANMATSSGTGYGGSNALQVTTTAGFGSAHESLTTSAGMLIKSSAYLKVGTGSSDQKLEITDTAYGSLAVTAWVAPANWTQYVLYATSGVTNQVGNQYYSNYNNGTMSQYSVPSSKQVITPSATGVTITSTAGGSTYAWASEESGFNRNDTTYSYAITSSTVYYISYTTAPTQVFEDGSRLSQNVTSYASLVPGQWYLDMVATKIWVRLTGDDAPSNGHTIQASQRAMAIDIGDGNAYAGVSYITVQGIHATMSNGGYGNIGLVHAATNHVIISGVTSDYSANDGIKISSTVEGGDINITGNVSNNNLGIGVSTNQYSGASLGHEVYIQYNNVSANQADGIETYGNYAIIQYNTVHDSGTTSTDCIGIHIYSASGSDGLGQHNIIRYNTVYNQMSNGFDGSGIETDHYAANNSLYGNVIYNNQGPCIDLWDSASVLVYNNTCYGNLRNPAFPGGHGEIVLGQALGLTNNITVENNITYPTSSGAYSIYIDATTAAKTLAFVHNLWYDPSNSDWWYAGSAGSTLAAWNSQTFAGSDLYGNPLMVAPASANFLLQPTSPALAAGVFIPGVSTANPPNIGAK